MDGDDTRETPGGRREEGQESQPDPDLGPWGAEAVQLGTNDTDAAPVVDTAGGPKIRPGGWLAVAAIVCAAVPLALLGAGILDGDPRTATDSRRTANPDSQRPAAEGNASGTGATRRETQARHQARRKVLRHRSNSKARSARPARGPSPDPAPPTTPAPEPVAPSPAPAPAPDPTPTTDPPAASGPTVAQEFGFER